MKFSKIFLTAILIGSARVQFIRSNTPKQDSPSNLKQPKTHYSEVKHCAKFSFSEFCIEDKCETEYTCEKCTEGYEYDKEAEKCYPVTDTTGGNSFSSTHAKANPWPSLKWFMIIGGAIVLITLILQECAGFKFSSDSGNTTGRGYAQFDNGTNLRNGGNMNSGGAGGYMYTGNQNNNVF